MPEMLASRTRGLAAALGLALVLTTTGARAEEDDAATARTQYNLGQQAYKSKRYVEAALHFEAAAALRPHPAPLYTAGLAWDFAAKPERAADAYSRCLALEGLDPKQDVLARERIEKLEKMLGTLSVKSPPGWKVQLDSNTETGTPARLHGAAGVHSLTYKIPGKGIEKQDVSLEVGKVTELELKEKPDEAPKQVEAPPPPPPPPAPPPAPRSFWTLRRSIGVGVAGVGVAAVGAGAIFGVQALSARDAYDAGPTRASFDHASGMQTWTNVMLISGAVLVAGGIALVVYPESDKPEGRMTFGIGPRGVVLGGTL